MEQQILDFIINHDTWKQFKKKYQILQQCKSHFCSFTNDLTHEHNIHINIIRFVINNEYEAKLYINNINNDIRLQYSKSMICDNWIINTPCHMRLPYTDFTICDTLNDNLNVTKVYKNYCIDRNEFRKYSSYGCITLGTIMTMDIDKLNNFIKTMIELFDKIIATIHNNSNNSVITQI